MVPTQLESQLDPMSDNRPERHKLSSLL